MTEANDVKLSPLAALAERAKRAPDETVLICADRRWTAGRLLEDCDRLASALAARGVRPGDRVALHMYNIAEAVIAYLACFRMGAIATPLNTRFKTEELSHWIERTAPAAYLGQSELYEHFAAVPQDLLPDSARYVAGTAADIGKARTWAGLMEAGQLGRRFDTPDPDAPAVLLATSGTTTGRGKLVVWTHRTLSAFGPAAAGLGTARGDIAAITVPLMHAGGLCSISAAMTQGARVVLVPRFDPDAVLDAIERHHCTSTGGLPFMCAALAQQQKQRPRDAASLRLCVVAGDVGPSELAEAFEAQFNAASLAPHYGATEQSGCTVPAGRVGPYHRLAPDVEIRVVNEAGDPVADGELGELWLKSPSTAAGYWEGPGIITPLPDGFFHSGDFVRMTAPREFQFMGRKKDLIVRGGSNISPLEIEAILQDHPNVREAAVAGIPDPVLGQRVGALLVLEDGANAASIIESARKRLADYKVPEIVEVADELPRNAATKIDRKAVADAIRRAAGRRAGKF